MDIPKNKFKAALLRHEVQIGLWFGLADPVCAEICANTGFDWMMIDGEHSPASLRDMLGMLQAVAPYPTQPVLRPAVGDPIVIKQWLDIGAQTLLIPMVETAEQAKMLAQAMHYPPKGMRGIGGATARAARWDAVDDYVHKAGSEVCLLLQIETRKALENIEAIAAVDGVDGLFVGPADLSASLGHLGGWNQPESQAAIADAIKRIRAAGKPAGILTTDETLARNYIKLGCSFVAVGIDTLLLQQSAIALAARFKNKS